MLPFDVRQSDNNVLLSPPPLLHVDPFPLDDILDVSVKKNKNNLETVSIQFIYFRLFVRLQLLHFNFFIHYPVAIKKLGILFLYIWSIFKGNQRKLVEILFREM